MTQLETRNSKPETPVAITMGDPAGIGPEVVLKAWRELHDTVPLKLIASYALMQRVAERLGLVMPPHTAFDEPAFGAGSPAAVVPGTVSAENGAAAGACIEHAIAHTLGGKYRALVTAPICKESIRAAGIPFPGHTEWLAQRCGVSGETMLLWSDRLAVALVTVHQALRSVPDAIDPHRIVAVGKQLAQIQRRLKGRPPKLCVLGLNPHAGEHGLFGDEDERAIVPAVAELLQLGIDVDGPLPPDTAFTPDKRARYDGYVCMYHDQGLIPFKALAFDEGVNVTLGLPIVRTSVDHGTAFDIAWQGKAQHSSLIAAIRLAERIAG